MTLLLAVLLMVQVGAGRTAHGQGTGRYAVLVTGLAETTPLAGELRELGAVLVDEHDFAEKRVRIVSGASAEAVRTTLDAVAERSRAGDLVLVVFAGPTFTAEAPGGGLRGMLRTTPATGTGDAEAVTGFAIDEVARTPALKSRRVLVVVDRPVRGLGVWEPMAGAVLRSAVPPRYVAALASEVPADVSTLAPTEATTLRLLPAFTEALRATPTREATVRTVLAAAVERLDEPARDRFGAYAYGPSQAILPLGARLAPRVGAPPAPGAMPAGTGTVSLRSEPSGARVTWRGQRLGTTPLTLPYVPAGEQSYQIDLPIDAQAIVSLYVVPGAEHEATTDFAQVAVPVTLPALIPEARGQPVRMQTDAAPWVPGTTHWMRPGPSQMQMFVGEHRATYQVDLRVGEPVVVGLGEGAPVLKAVYRTAFVPGWGQFADRSRLKGLGIFAAFVGSALGAVAADERFHQQRRTYDRAVAAYERASFGEVPQAREAMDQAYDRANQTRWLRRGLGFATVTVYALAFTDALVNHARPAQVIRPLAAPQGASATSARLKLSTHGVGIALAF